MFKVPKSSVRKSQFSCLLCQPERRKKVKLKSNITKFSQPFHVSHTSVTFRSLCLSLRQTFRPKGGKLIVCFRANKFLRKIWFSFTSWHCCLSQWIRFRKCLNCGSIIGNINLSREHLKLSFCLLHTLPWCLYSASQKYCAMSSHLSLHSIFFSFPWKNA
jgi:hypothetical protein